MLLFVRFLNKLMSCGQLTVIDADGNTHVFDQGPAEGLIPVTVRMHKKSLHWQLALRPALAVGEGYMDGSFTVEQGTIYDLLALAAENIHRADPQYSPGEHLSALLRRLQQWNPMDVSKRNVAHHYDLSGALYDLFLDKDRQYSCAYFALPEMSIDDAQIAKKKHIMAKLDLKPGQRVLDIGCGWGGLALSIAKSADVEVTGITLSEEQLKVAQRRAEEAQLAHKVRFLLCDYRSLTGSFDRIVSVGMFEHVGIGHYQTFFNTIRDRLNDAGVALVHSIGRFHGPGATNPWIRKYIFPGGYVPALSEVMPVVEKTGLFTTDIEILRLHYADTLRLWRKRFMARRDEAVKLYDEKFARMWEFYLAGAETAFRHSGQMVFQIQLAKKLENLPRTRDYIAQNEQAFGTI
ncbi:MAG TPA: cyclopropane-fatty-acyl-phospholipid synthase family protein [Magnetospirillaceae bacterium]|jgi:cyclopropane-fatty-acyl-phospholipid synthase